MIHIGSTSRTSVARWLLLCLGIHFVTPFEIGPEAKNRGALSASGALETMAVRVLA